MEDRHSNWVEAHAALSLQALEERPQIHLRELRNASMDYSKLGIIN